MGIWKLISKISDIMYCKKIQYRYQLKSKVHVKKPFIMIGEQFITLGGDFCADKDVRIEAWESRGGEKYNPNIVIGRNAFINTGTHISAICSLKIGDNFLAGSYVSIIDNDHGQSNTIEELKKAPQERKLYSKGAITIGNNVWVGDKACIFGGVTIGNGVVIGANAIVTHDIPDYSVAVGNPARVIKMISRDNEI